MKAVDSISNYVTIGVVTALPKEYAAITCMMDEIFQHSTPRGRGYTVGSIPAAGNGKHWVAVALGDQGTASASHHATLIKEDFLQIKVILMVGIAGGVPSPNSPEKHVRLGDIVALGEKGIAAYDFVKDHGDRLESRFLPNRPHSKFLTAARLLHAGALIGNFPWLAHLSRASKVANSSRPDDDKDVLYDSDDQSKVVIHPDDPDRRPGEPRVFIGTIGCANRLLKNPKLRDQVRDDYGALAIEMEGYGIAEASWGEDVGFYVVRGICDYCNAHKNNIWQEYAAAVAAAYSRELLGKIAPFDLPPTYAEEVRSVELTEDQLNDVASKLIQANTPPTLLTLFQEIEPSKQEAIREMASIPRTLARREKNKTDRVAPKIPCLSNCVTKGDMQYVGHGNHKSRNQFS